MRIAVGTTIGRYRVERFIGEGGMGEVYLARDDQLDRSVALKLLPESLRSDEEFRRRLESEARAASALNHPNILTIHEIGDSSGERFIATEFVDGVTLREAIRNGGMSLTEALRIVLQIAEALAAAETHGVIHRDIKPENIMIRHDGYVKVLDFGLARRITIGGDHAEERGVRGTIRYMSPEQLRGMPADSRTDVWSVGVVFHEMLTGQLPFERDDTAQIITAIVEEPHPPVGGPPELHALLDRALKKHCEERFSGMRQMLGALLALQNTIERRGSHPTVEDDAGEIARAIDTPLPRKQKPKSNLPTLLTPVVGRDEEIKAIRHLLALDNVRLITLTGPGGTGKTRLAMEVAHAVSGSFADGVYFVSLASVSDVDRVPGAVAKILDVHEDAGGSLLESIKRELANRSVLLLLDNLEQIANVGTMLVEILQSAPDVKILATSQAVLRVRGEREFAVPPLALPSSSDRSPLALAKNPSVALFVERAQALQPDFVLSPENASVVAKICERLDGLPLAIELAAARIRLLPPAVMLERLDSRLKVLTSGPRDLPARQQTMRTAISWGFNLLEPQEKKLFARMSVFAGGATLDAANAVCSNGLAIGVAEGIESLVDKSFIRLEAHDEAPRFVILETLREFGLEALTMSGETEAIRRRHAEFFLELAEEAEPELKHEGQSRWLQRLEDEHENLQAAIEWACENGEREIALRIAGALWWFWYLRGYYAVGRTWLGAALQIDASIADRLRARALVGAGRLAFLQCDYDGASALLDEVVNISRQENDSSLLGSALQSLGSIARERGEYDHAIDLHTMAMSISQDTGDRSGVARSLNYIGFASWLAGDFERPAQVCGEALTMFRELGDGEGIAWSIMNLAATAYGRGEIEEAMKLAKQALQASRDVGFKEGVAWSLNILGNVSHRRGDMARGEEFLRRSLRYHWELGDRWRTASVLDAIASFRIAADDHERAAILFGAAQSLREMIGTPVPAAEAFDHHLDLARSRDHLGEELFEELQSRGASTPIHEIVEELFNAT